MLASKRKGFQNYKIDWPGEPETQVVLLDSPLVVRHLRVSGGRKVIANTPHSHLHAE